jgi:hypothetical protein
VPPRRAAVPLRPVQKKRKPKAPQRRTSKPLPPTIDAVPSMISINPVMFEPVTDLMSWKDLEAPASNHPVRLAEYQEAVEDEIDTVVSSLEGTTAAEEASLGAAKEIGFALLKKFLGRARAVGWGAQSVDERIEAVEQILRSPQVPQRTPAWYLQGKTVLTASEFATLYGTARAVGQLVMNKVPPAEPIVQLSNRLACMTCEMGPFDWGVRFEPVVKQVLGARWGAKIVESGRIMHPTDSYVAASPDGFIVDATDPARIGRLLEIKCPIRRTIGEGVPFEYWCQMQIQMEVTGIGECEYVEVKLDSIEKGATDLSGSAAADGFVWLLQNPATCEMRYAYTVQERAEMEEGWSLVETIPWRVAGMYSEVVVRDRAWFASTAEMRERFWLDVAKARAGQFEVPAGRVRSPKPISGAAGTVVTVIKEGCQIMD